MIVNVDALAFADGVGPALDEGLVTIKTGELAQHLQVRAVDEASQSAHAGLLPCQEVVGVVARGQGVLDRLRAADLRGGEAPLDRCFPAENEAGQRGQGFGIVELRREEWNPPWPAKRTGGAAAPIAKHLAPR